MTQDVSKIRETTVYPPDARKGRTDLDLIDVDAMGSIAHIFAERVRRSGGKTAVREFDHASRAWVDYSWQELAVDVVRWQQAFESEGLTAGDKVAIRFSNSRRWVAFDIAALGLGLVVVPLYTADRGDNVAYVLNHSETALLYLEHAGMWDEIAGLRADFANVRRVVVHSDQRPDDESSATTAVQVRLDTAEGVVMEDSWLPAADTNGEIRLLLEDPKQLASIVYTSGTTGRPKGVMLSHWNMMTNCASGLAGFAVTPQDVFLSFLPLSHTLERTVGYYTPIMAGASIAYARSIPDLPDDLKTIQPTMIISVPRIFERVYGKIQDGLEASAFRRKLFNFAVDVGWDRFLFNQGRGPKTFRMIFWPILYKLVSGKLAAGLGGRLRGAVSGGAPLPKAVGKAFNALDIPIFQGYGLTESSPSLSINTFDFNIPWSIGLPLRGVEMMLGDNDELIVRGENIMMGYWKNEAATAEVLDKDGWLKTGDCARIDENGFVYITGRIKDIIVLSNGEKVPPADMESAIARDGLFDQIMVVGEGRSFLSVLVCLNPEIWARTANRLGVDPNDPESLHDERVHEALLARVREQIAEFPGYARIFKITPMLEPWTVENGLATPTLKIKRPQMREYFASEIEAMYAGH